MSTLYLNFFAQLALILGLPALFSAGSAYFSWRALPRPWTFLLATTVALYVIYFLVFYFFAPAVGGISISRVDSSHPAIQSPSFILLRPYVKTLLIFVGVALPVLAGSIAVFRR